TKLSQAVWTDAEALKKIESKIPLGSIARPEQMVGPVLFLASEDSDYVTGQTIFVDGGISI
ncbi:MAG: SDR family oxidoreductase, partial [Desulfatiglandales bacterium]|nr:SDR family oxidoreductase [Desulfatiglandales bacterium]